MSRIINQLNRLSTFAGHYRHPWANFLPSTLRPLTLGLLLTFSFLVLQCGLDVEDPTPPSPPVWIQKSLPQEWPERGIDADESGGIILEWEQNLVENVHEFLLFRAKYDVKDDTTAILYELLSRVNQQNSAVMQYVDSEVQNNIKYSYRIKAEDISGNRSDFSTAVTYKVFPQILQSSLQPNGIHMQLPIDRTLHWIYYHNVEMEDYLMTILDVSNDDLILRIPFNPGDYTNWNESWVIPDSVLFKSRNIYKWRIDMAGAYADGVENAGSESVWATFLYITD
jgi:hypothetical protein